MLGSGEVQRNIRAACITWSLSPTNMFSSLLKEPKSEDSGQLDSKARGEPCSKLLVLGKLGPYRCGYTLLALPCHAADENKMLDVQQDWD